MATITDPTNSTRATPNIAAADAVCHLGSSAFIAAPSTQVWAALLDTSTWPSWNTFVPRVTIRSHPDSTDDAPLSPVLRRGTRMIFHVRMDPTSPKPQAARDVFLTVTEFTAPNPSTQTPGRIVWVIDGDVAGAMPQMLLNAEREHEVVDMEQDGQAGTMVRNWELQVGWMVYMIKWTMGAKLQANFELWVSDLKKYVEGSTSS
ncbi:hypothetical protein N7462_001944 [Penicillium macrosclerotiorum]|uniref:uncharacterized protein n=1 Tax=Penicillium macrosclerotiorum TaxID=303699 RepID=UPI002547FDD1|nr:uncharacterized protein N7462_001944 [Penicillium macrosclerotiorum]KAJ5692521.1 hypothetical protein N7462_001944 [Penicillium macrosclerotiorum]